MNQSQLNELYRLEEKLQLLDADLRVLAQKIPMIEQTLREVKNLDIKFQNDRKDVWEYIHALTQGLREGERLNK